MSEQSNSTPHLPRLDVLRGLAILFVFFIHFYALFPGWSPGWNGLVRDYSRWPIYSYPLLPIVWGGELGVPLFFVLSGFCIHLSYLRRKKRLNVGDFYWRRFLRIYPAYVGAIIVALCLASWFPSKYLHLYQILPHLLLIHNFFKCTFPGINGVFWSLGVECQFYLLYPLLLWAQSRWTLPKCLVVALVINLLLQIYFLSSSRVINSPVSVYWSFPLVTWCDWILGACIAEAFVQRRRFFEHGELIMIASLVFFIAAQVFKNIHVQSFLFASVFFATVMDRYIAWDSPLTRVERSLVPVGLISYSLYLLHAPLMYVGFDLVKWTGIAANNYTIPLVYLPLVCIFSIPPAVLSYYYLELLPPRFFKAKKKVPVFETAGSSTVQPS